MRLNSDRFVYSDTYQAEKRAIERETARALAAASQADEKAERARQALQKRIDDKTEMLDSRIDGYVVKFLGVVGVAYLGLIGIAVGVALSRGPG